MPYLEPEDAIEKADLLHFTGTKKPWNFNKGKYPYKGAEIWWNYFTNGPIKVD